MISKKVHDQEVTVIRPGAERLTAENANSFRTEVMALIDAGATRVVVDLEGVSFLDSTGLGALVGVLKKLGNHGKFAISGLNLDVDRMFRLCRMDRVFKVFHDKDAAVQSMGAAS